MALTARQLDRLVETLASIYEDAELRLLEHIARQLTQGLDSPTWAMDKLRARFGKDAVIRGKLYERHKARQSRDQESPEQQEKPDDLPPR